MVIQTRIWSLDTKLILYCHIVEVETFSPGFLSGNFKDPIILGSRETNPTRHLSLGWDFCKQELPSLDGSGSFGSFTIFVSGATLWQRLQ